MFKNKDFLILLLGRFITNLGDSIYTIATMSIIYSMTGSTLYTGIALFLTSSMGIFQLILSPMLDRINMKRFLVVSQFAQGILLLIIPVLQFQEILTVYHILIIMPIISLINQLVYPGQISLLPKILDEKDLVKGNSLFSIAYQGTDSIFNALSGVVIVAFGIMSAFYINSITFFINSILFVFLSKTLSNFNSQNNKIEGNIVVDHFSRLKEGLKIWKHDILFPLLVGIILINFAGTGIYANLPAYSNNEIFYSLLLSASGIGVLLGSLIANIRCFQKLKMGKFYIYNIALTGMSWMGMSFLNITVSSGKVLAFILFLLGWLFIGILNVYSQTLIQLMVPQKNIASAIGAMLGLSVGLAPLGALFGGFLGKYTSSKNAILFFGFLIISVAVYWISQKAISGMKSMLELQGIDLKEI